MDLDSRVDLFISFNDSEKLSAGFTTRELVTATKNQVCARPSNLGIAPFVFFESRAQWSEIVDAVLQTRPGGLALFLLTPDFFNNSLCVAELRAFLEVRSDSKVTVKLRFICIESSAEDILSTPLVKNQFPDLSCFVLRADICLTSVQEASSDLCNIVFGAWECSDGEVSSHNVPTILGHTRHSSFLALQRVLTEDDLPTFRAVLSLPRNVTNMLDAFSIASERGTVTMDNVEKLHEVIRFRRSPTEEEQHRMVEAYEHKWVHSKLLSWGDEQRKDFLLFFKNQESGATQGSSSTRPQKRPRKPDTVAQEMSEINPKRPRETVDEFEAYFDEPPISHNVVLDFESCDDKGEPVTSEGLLLRKVLGLVNGHGRRTVSARGKQRSAICGMGGVGKTTALRGLCYEEQVKEAYCDGICFLESGQDADDQKVIKEVARCMRVFGGIKMAQEMEESRCLPDALAKGAAWQHKKTVLLVCDDLWANKNKHGYLRDLTILLREAPRSRLLISTRDRNIAKSTGDSVEFAPLDAENDKAQKILLADVPDMDVVANISGKDTEDGIRRILKICAGLPLALAIAGQGLETFVRDCDSIPNGVRQYCNLLEEDSDCIVVDGFHYYPGLAKVIDSSLKQCQEWGTGADVVQKFGKLDMINMFKGLCVLQKQMIIPKRALKHLWGTDDKCTSKVMRTFADYNLASRVATGESTQQEYGLRLHDLVLERCQQIAGRERITWHSRIVDAYKKKLEKKNCDDDEGEKSLAWWCAQDDGYLFAHLSRHLALRGQARQLEHLLCDIRWTMLRLKVGGWLSLKSDFEHLFGVGKHAAYSMRRVHVVLELSFPYARARVNSLAFFVFAHLSRKEREQARIALLLSSIDRHFPKPWLRPVTKCIAVFSNSREEWKEAFTSDVNDIIVDWSKETMFVATDHEIILWCTRDRRTLWTIPGGTNAVALSRCGSLVLSASQNHAIRRWNAENGAPIGEPMHGHDAYVHCIALSEDRSLIVSGSADNTIRRWDAKSGEPIGEPLKGHSTSVNCLAVSRDASVIVSGSADSTIRQWDARSGLPIGEPLRGHENSVRCVSLSLDEKVIVSASSDNTIRRWESHNGAPIGEPLEGHVDEVDCVALSEDGNVIVSGSWDNTIRQWDARSGASIGEPLRGHEDIVSCVAVSKDGKTIVSGSWDCTIRRWDSHNRVLIGIPPRGRDSYKPLHSDAVSPKGEGVLSVSSDKTLARSISRSEAQVSNSLCRHGSAVKCVAISEDGRVIVSGSRDNTVRRWDAQSGAPIGGPMRGHEHTVGCVSVSEDAKLIVSGSLDDTIRRWDAQSGEPIGEPLEGHSNSVSCIALSEDKSVIVSGSDDRTVRRWDARSRLPIGGSMHGHEDTVCCVAVSEGGRLIVSGSGDNTIRRWDAHTGAQIGKTLQGHLSYVHCIALSKDASVIVSGSLDRTIRQWDARSGLPIGEPLCGHEGCVDFVALSRDEKVIVSGSIDSTVKPWNALGGVPVGELLRRGEGTVEPVTASDVGSTVFPRSDDKTSRRENGHALPCAHGSDSSQCSGPTNVMCIAVNFEKQLYVFGLWNGSVSICYAMQ